MAFATLVFVSGLILLVQDTNDVLVLQVGADEHLLIVKFLS